MKQEQYRCGQCGAAFSSLEGLEEHHRMTHSRYTCGACGAVMGSERELEEHNRERHPELDRNRPLAS